MNVIVRRAILYYAERYPGARVSLLAWYDVFVRQDFKSFNELKAVYGHASLVGNHRVIFNIKGNEFRLIISVNFRKKAAYVIWFGTHAEYDRIDARTIKFNTDILNYKVKKL